MSDIVERLYGANHQECKTGLVLKHTDSDALNHIINSLVSLDTTPRCKSVRAKKVRRIKKRADALGIDFRAAAKKARKILKAMYPPETLAERHARLARWRAEDALEAEWNSAIDRYYDLIEGEG